MYQIDFNKMFSDSKISQNQFLFLRKISNLLDKQHKINTSN